MGFDTAEKAHSLAIDQNFELVSSVPTQVTQCEHLEAFWFQMVTTKEDENVIKRFSSSKAPGHDKISSRVLKDSLPITLTAITHLNNSFNSNTFAEAWKVAEVVSILKSSSDIKNPWDSRPILCFPFSLKFQRDWLMDNLLIT